MIKVTGRILPQPVPYPLSSATESACSCLVSTQAVCRPPSRRARTSPHLQSYGTPSHASSHSVLPVTLCVVGIFMPVAQIWKLRLGKTKLLARSHTVSLRSYVGPDSQAGPRQCCVSSSSCEELEFQDLK